MKLSITLEQIERNALKMGTLEGLVLVAIDTLERDTSTETGKMLQQSSLEFIKRKFAEVTDNE